MIEMVKAQEAEVIPVASIAPYGKMKYTKQFPDKRLGPRALLRKRIAAGEIAPTIPRKNYKPKRTEYDRIQARIRLAKLKLDPIKYAEHC
jgi:hypothetical protein